MVQHAFRLECEDAQSSSKMIDHAFGALRMMHSVEAWVTSSALALLSFFGRPRCPRRVCSAEPQRSCSLADNELYDSLEGLSDREAPAQESMNVVAQQLVARA